MKNETIRAGTHGKFLVIKPSSLGDIVHSLPFLNAIHKKFPKTEIHWVVAGGFEGILEGHPMIKKLWIIRKDEWKEINRLHATISEIRRLFRELKSEGYDIVIDLQGLLRSGMIARATGAPVRVGFRESREGSSAFYTHKVDADMNMHAVDRYLTVAKHLGCDASDPKFPFPPDLLNEDFLAGMGIPEKYIVMAPGARKPANRWPAERFGKLASTLNIRSVIVGSRGDIKLAEAATGNSNGNAVSVAGMTDIKCLTCIIRGARLVVSNDSGPMHIAAALGVPVVAIFGPANPARTGPYGKGHVVVRKDIPCSPCCKRTCKNPECIDSITVNDVASAIKNLLGAGPASRI